MNKEEIERQLKLSKRQNKDERYDYLDSEFNAINYCIKLEKYTNKLLKENQELNKQFEKTNTTLDTHNELIEYMKNQQKEFINFLENEKDRCLTFYSSTECMYAYDVFKDVLSKYYEIIGYVNE